MNGEVRIDRPAAGVARLTIDNPPVNPLGPAMRAAFMAVLDEAEADPHLRALIITGARRAFCSGDDLKAVGEGGEDLASFARLLDRLEACRAATVAAVNGWCVGGGFELALCCDLRIAAPEARFVCAGVNMGLMVSAWRLPRLIGVSRAKAMLLTGSPFDAETAERFGLVTGLFPAEALAEEALALASRIASRAPLSVEATKRVASRAPDLSPEEAARMQRAELEVLRASRDHHEAVTAFREKREPRFESR